MRSRNKIIQLENSEQAFLQYVSTTHRRYLLKQDQEDKSLCGREVFQQPARRPFRIEEIDQIFDPKNFSAWTQERPDRYWGTLLGAGTGARVNEIAQLYVEDVAEVGGIWGIHIRATRKDQKLKNANSQRFIPLHPELLRAGFLTYIQDATAAGHDRVFPQLPWHQKAGYGDALGDQFRAYLTKLGMAQPGFGFHSFRHTASTRLGKV